MSTFIFLIFPSFLLIYFVYILSIYSHFTALTLFSWWDCQSKHFHTDIAKTLRSLCLMLTAGHLRPLGLKDDSSSLPSDFSCFSGFFQIFSQLKPCQKPQLRGHIWISEEFAESPQSRSKLFKQCKQYTAKIRSRKQLTQTFKYYC